MCKYCNTTNGTVLIDSSIENGEGLMISLDAESGELIVDTEHDSDCMCGCDFMATHINYCPMCGRKL